MSAELHARAKERFLALLELEPTTRAAALAELEAADVPLAAAVRRLLAADEATAAEFLDRPPPQLLRFATASVTGSEVRGDRSYRLLRELGRGGMGVVYLVERADGEFRQQMALKVLHRGGEQVLQRFKTERQILASLNHPYIARLLDGGSLPDGAPFLVMEYVDGVRIDRFAAEHELSISARLRLFLRVATAVAAAHRQLVVHRDLKPANILVTADGNPKLLDFGIAKLLDEATTDWTVAETLPGASPLTLRYASPEQVRGESVSTATDLYALGVLLFELLTGRSPYRDPEGSPYQLARQICDEEPERASDAASTADGSAASTTWPRRRRLPRDLDAIVGKALAKAPEARYPSVDALAEDLRRFLDGQPVAARQGDRRYRLGRLLRRNRWPLSAALGLVGVLVGWGLSLSHQLEVAQRERDKARAVSDFLVRLFRETDPDTSGGGATTARELLDRGSSEAETALLDQPALRAELLDTLGVVYDSFGVFDRAEPALRQALDLRRNLAGEEPLALADTLAHLGTLLRDSERAAEAEPLFEEELALVRRHLPEDDLRLLVALNRLATLRWEQGRTEESRHLLEEVLASHLRRLNLSLSPLVLPQPPLPDEYWDLAFVLHNLGNHAYGQRDLERAETLLEQSLAVERRLAGEEHTSIAKSLVVLGSCANARGDYARSLELNLRALAMRRKLLGEAHPFTAATEMNVGNQLQLLGRMSEAIEHYEKALAVQRQQLGEDSAGVAFVLVNLAPAYARAGRVAEGLEAAERAVALRLVHFAPDDPNLAYARASLATCLALAGRQREALVERRQAIEIFRGEHGDDYPDLLDTRVDLGRDLAALGERGVAEAELRDLKRRLEGPVGATPASPWLRMLLADTELALAELLGATPAGRIEARALATSALARVRALPAQGRVDPAVIEALLAGLGPPPR